MRTQAAFLLHALAAATWLLCAVAGIDLDASGLLSLVSDHGGQVTYPGLLLKACVWQGLTVTVSRTVAPSPARPSSAQPSEMMMAASPSTSNSKALSCSAAEGVQ